MKNDILVFLVFLIVGYSLQSQSSGPQFEEDQSFFKSESFFQTSQKDSLNLWRENVLLHIDSKQYMPKESLFFKAFVLTGPNRLRVSASDVLRIELLDEAGNLIIDQYHRINEGSANGYLQLPKKIEEGKYYLRAYTRWMLNYGEEDLPLREVFISKSGKLEGMEEGRIAIYPEGNDFVYGLENKGILADSEGGKIDGRIVNESGTSVANVVDYGNGIGSFVFYPKVGQNYFYEKPNGEKVRFVEPSEVGAILQANNIEGNQLRVRITATEELLQSSYFLKAQRDGKYYLKTEIKFEEGQNHVEVKIQKEGLPDGLLLLTLEDDYGQRWAERPFYIDANRLQISVTKISENIENDFRKFRYKINLKDNEDNPISSEVLVNINNKHYKVGGVEQFENDRSSNYLTDLKVLANQLPDNSESKKKYKTPDKIKYAFQRGLEFYGQAYDLNNTLLIDEKIQIFINNENEVDVREVDTNSEGLFTLTGLQLEGDVTMTFRREAENIKEQLVKVIPYQYELPKLKIEEVETLERSDRIKKSGQIIPQKRLADFDFEDKPSNLIALEEVTLEAKRILQKTSASVYGIEPDRVVFQDPERPKTIPQLFLGIPGVMVTGMGDLNPSLSIPAAAGAGSLLWVIDGFPMDQGSFSVTSANVSDTGSLSITSARSPGTNLRTIMDLVPFIDVERIELLFGANASIYGSRGSGGVIAIYTKNGAYSTEYVNRNAAQIEFKGFQSNVDFDEFFAVNNRKKAKQKSSSTLYWNPTLQTDENGEAFFEFSVPKTYDEVFVEVEAFTEEGLRGSLKSLSRL